MTISTKGARTPTSTLDKTRRRVQTCVRRSIAALGMLALFTQTAHARLTATPVDDPIIVKVELETDFLAYDIGRSPNADKARSLVVDLAIEQILDPASLYVLMLPQLSPQWTPLDEGELIGLDGDPINNRLANEKRGYIQSLDEAITDILGRIRDQRPGVHLSVGGFVGVGRGSVQRFPGVADAIDFVYVDKDFLKQAPPSKRSREINRLVRAHWKWFRFHAVSKSRFVVFRAGEKWMAASQSDLTADLAPDPQRQAQQWEPKSSSESSPESDKQLAASDDAAPADKPTSEFTPPVRRTATARNPAFRPSRPSADLNGDGLIDTQDQAMLLGFWGTNNTSADLDGDGSVGSGDLAILLGSMSRAVSNPGAPSAPAAEIVPLIHNYDQGSGVDLEFNVLSAAPQGASVEFQIWSFETNRIEATYTDREEPYMYPSSRIDLATPGRAQVQAVLRDDRDQPLTTIAVDMTLRQPTSGANDNPNSLDDSDNQPDNSDDGISDGPTGVDAQFRMGMNLGWLTYFSRDWVFVDVFKASQATKQPHLWKLNQGDIKLTADGYPLGLAPGQVASALMCREIEGHYPRGQYVCLFQGDGEVSVSFDADQVSYNSPGGKLARFTFNVTPSNRGIKLSILRSNRANPVRNIRVYMPGFERQGEIARSQGRSMFHPLFLKGLAPFKAIRFMDWQRTNDSDIVKWSDRVTPTFRTQAGPRGVAIENMIDLCNKLGASPWLCMPHQASVDFMRQYAKLVRDRLDPNIKIYLEYSNEVWNPQFEQYAWVRDNAPSDLKFPAKYAYFTKRMFDAWASVFGDQMSSRVIRVAAGQEQNPWMLKKTLEALHGDCDAGAVGGYFGLDRKMKIKSSATADDFITLLQDRIHTNTIPRLKENKEHTDKWNIPLIVYEGGQGVTPRPAGSSPPYLQAMYNMQSDPRLYNVYIDLLTAFKDMGGGIYCAYSYVGPKTQWGSWGHLEWQNQDPNTAPKFKAVVDAAKNADP